MKGHIILFALAIITACNSATIQERLNEIDCYVDSDPQSALTALTEMDLSGIKSDRIKAHYSLLHSKAIDKCYIDTTDVSVVNDAVSYYSKHGNCDEKMQSFYYLGRIYGNAGRYTESILALTRAIEEGAQSFDVKYKGRVYIAMADAHNHNYNVLEEGRCVDKALEYFYASGDSVQIRSATYRKALSCLNQGEIESSDSLFQSLLSIPELKLSTKANCLVKYAYLLATIDNIDYDRTYKLFKDAIAAGAQFSKKDIAAYAYVLWCVGDTAGSDAVFRDLERRDSTIVGITSYWKGRIKQKQGHYKEAFNYLYKVVDYQSKGVNNALQQSLSIAQRDYYSSFAEQQKAAAHNSKTIALLIGIVSISLLFLMLYICLSAIRRSRERNFQAIADLDYINDHLMHVQQSVAEKDAKIESLQEKFLNVFREHFRFLAQFYETYNNNRGSGYEGSTTYKRIQDVFRSIIGEEESDHIFEKIIDRDMDGLISRFREDYPTFKNIDYLLFCFIVAGYDAKTISILLTERSPYSIHTRKSRLKKVIAESDVKNKEEYLKYF